MNRAAKLRAPSSSSEESTITKLMIRLAADVKGVKTTFTQAAAL
jgi:hypothetical protein